MKNLKVSLLFAVLSTGLVLAGCQQPAPAPVDTQAVTGSIKIEDSSNTATVNGSVSIEEANEKEVNGAVTIAPATDSAMTDAALDTATKAMEEANGTVN